MFNVPLLLTSFLSLGASLVAGQADAVGGIDNSTLWVSAIVGKNGVSTAECWGIQPPFVVSSQVSVNLSFALSWHALYSRFSLFLSHNSLFALNLQHVHRLITIGFGSDVAGYCG